MHMADALISPAVGVAFYAASAGVAAYSLKKIKVDDISENKTSLMGVVGAFVFAAQMVNFAIPGTGSSGHLGGGLLLSILLGPARAFLVMGSVLLVQALFFADGGLLAFGCNWFNLGVFPCFVAYPLIWRPIARKGHYITATMSAAVLALLLGSGAIALQAAGSGIAELPFVPFLTLMLSVHFVIGIVEGAATEGVIAFVRKARPELVSIGKRENKISVRRVAVAFLLLALLVGGFVSLYAASAPDGLEWSIEKIAGTAELEARSDVHSASAELQNKTSLLPDYSLSGFASWFGTSVSGVVGSVAVLAMAGGIAFWAKKTG